MKKKIEIQVFDIPIPNTEALERDVLADAIAAPELLGDTIPVIHKDFFTSDERRELWEAIVMKYNAGEISEIGPSMMVNYPAVLTEIAPCFTDAGTSETPFRAMLLRDGAAKRRAYFAAAQFLSETIKPTTTEQEILALSESFGRSLEGPAPIQGEKIVSEVVEEVREEIKRTQDAVNAGKILRVTTGFPEIDQFINGGYKAGQLIILAARPSVGKTALMLQMARWAAQSGSPVQVFSLEMTKTELAERLLFSTEQIRPYQVNTGQIDWQMFKYAENMIAPLPIYINDFSRSLDDIVSRMTHAVKKGRCKVAYIDYLGLMQDALNFGNAKLYQVIARITGTLKAVAKRLEIPIVLLCQMNREAAREGRAPELYDLRDSGSIEQDADIVMMLDNKLASDNKLHIYLRKNRAGKKEVEFILEPNDTYSAFGNVKVILPTGAPAPALPPPIQGKIEMQDDDKDLPF